MIVGRVYIRVICRVCKAFLGLSGVNFCNKVSVGGKYNVVMGGYKK